MGRYGVDISRVLELCKQGKTSGQIAAELGCKSATITKKKQELRALGVRWEGDGVGDDDYDPADDEDAESTGALPWPDNRPPPIVEQDPDVLEARKRTALKQQELADLKVERELFRLRLEVEGKQTPDANATMTTEILRALIAQQQHRPPSFWTPQLVTAVVSGAVTAVQTLRQPPSDPLKMFAEFQKIIATAGGLASGGDDDVAEGNILGTVVRALAKIPANPQPQAPHQGPPQAQQQPQQQVDERRKRNMQFLGLIARECRMGSDPAIMAGAMRESLGVLPEEFRRMILEESLSAILSALPAIVPPEVAQDFAQLGSDQRHRAWLETFLRSIRDGNRLGGAVEEAEEPVQPPAGYDLFPAPDPSSSVVLPPNGPQLPPSA